VRRERRATRAASDERRATRATCDTNDAETTLLIYKSPVSTTAGKTKTSVTISARRWK
jgi:hypothetical protein